MIAEWISSQTVFYQVLNAVQWWCLKKIKKKGDWKDSVITSEKPDTHFCQSLYFPEGK